MAPGSAPVYTPCGAAGGNPLGIFTSLSTLRSLTIFTRLTIQLYHSQPFILDFSLKFWLRSFVRTRNQDSPILCPVIFPILNIPHFPRITFLQISTAGCPEGAPGGPGEDCGYPYGGGFAYGPKAENFDFQGLLSL